MKFDICVACLVLVLLQMLNDNEEVLMHVFEGSLPGGYQLGLYEHCRKTSGNHDRALQQAEQLLQVQASIHHLSTSFIACYMHDIQLLGYNDGGRS